MRGKFKKCPFCGNEAGIRDVYGVIDWTEDCEPVTRRMFVCECKGEECWVSPVTDEFYTEEEAIEAWNRRSEGAIKALEQEPCEDCVNRQTVLNTLFYKSDNNCEVVLNKELQDRIKALPSVTPQPKTGHWIEKYAEDACGERYSYWACSECGRSVGFNLANIKDVLSDYPYCHCGAKMVESQERSEKE